MYLVLCAVLPHGGGGGDHFICSECNEQALVSLRLKKIIVAKVC